jgi:hypothetical protein
MLQEFEFRSEAGQFTDARHRVRIIYARLACENP